MAGIPEYRLPREVVRNEVDLIRSLGVEIQTGVTVGRDVTLDELRQQGYAAFFLGIGAHLGYKLKIEGENDFPQVYDVISFLRQVNLGDKEKPTDEVVIIGGGNAAMDAARTCVRLGCREVHVSYRRTRKGGSAAHRRDRAGPGGRGADSFSDGAHQDRRRAGPGAVPRMPPGRVGPSGRLRPAPAFAGAGQQLQDRGGRSLPPSASSRTSVPFRSRRCRPVPVHHRHRAW